MNDLELIEKYFRGELSEAERTAFGERMAADEAFQQAVVLHERALAAIRYGSLRDLKKNFQQRETAFRRQEKNARWRWLAALFVFLLLATGGWWFWNKRAQNQALPSQTQVLRPTSDSLNQTLLSPSDTPQLEQTLPAVKDSLQLPPPVAQRKPNAQQLFAAAFQPYRDASLNPTVRDEQNPTPFDQFLQLYWKNKHALALAAFENLSPALRSSDDALFLKANSLLAISQPTQAIPLFEGILANGESRFSGEAKWYLALCFLKQGKLDKTKKQLETLVSDADAPHRAEAMGILGQLR